MQTTKEKGDSLEIAFYNYLLEQRARGDLIYDAHTPELCKIHHKKSYYCDERIADIEFDVVVELFRKGAVEPHFTIFFECKNHVGAVQERDVTDFSDKVGRLRKNAAKCVLVVRSSLQSGAFNVAKKRGIGVAKFHADALEVIAERKCGLLIENNYLKSQIFETDNDVKSLKFAAFFDGKFTASTEDFFASLGITQTELKGGLASALPFITSKELQGAAEVLLKSINYESGSVDLKSICELLQIKLDFNDHQVRTDRGDLILGHANFDQKSIAINSHYNSQQQRFTLAHEIGHFHLKHGRYLRAENTIERDMLIGSEVMPSFNFQRLEFQANIFASHLLLPETLFRHAVSTFRERLNIVDRGFGYIFVDDQPCNLQPYLNLLKAISRYFDVSKQAVEVKLKTLKMLNDSRTKLFDASIGGALNNSIARRSNQVSKV